MTILVLCVACGAWLARNHLAGRGLHVCNGVIATILFSNQSKYAVFIGNGSIGGWRGGGWRRLAAAA
jgi:hypothetical protein